MLSAGCHQGKRGLNAFGYVLWETHSLFFCFDTAPDLLENLQGQLSEFIHPAPKMHLGMCPSAVALSGMLPQCSFDFREILVFLWLSINKYRIEP